MPATSQRVLGLAAMLVTVTIWASLFISLRQASQSVLTSGDIALLRFLPAALLFGWLSRHRIRHIISVPKRYLFAIAFGAGLPFYLLAATGMQFAPVADGASLIPGILPLFVSAIAWGVYGESLSVGRRLGIGLIVTGIGAFLWHSLFFSPWSVTQGHLILLAASISWAWFTIGVRVTGLNAAEAGAVLAISAVLLLPVGAMSGLVSFNLLQAPLGELGYHVLAQGLGVGIIANYSYAFAIRRLGAEMSAAIGAFTPVVAALIAIPVFSETVSLLTVVAMALIVFGAVLASEGIKWRRTQTKSGPQAA
ncbi:hypothetical protein BZJ17_00185 [Salinivibrio sp. IB574]|uniref:DMT family transporter n=1 Tax=Salinivibrio sp. IB574 TaxID=1909444 RepID=UPI0009892397|nr:DMT family transporter [Salinivibrio sp. IB574]OOF24588.1 hypothetical protein BZJ17_00185 [Salinivibrio sp. IB574]